MFTITQKQYYSIQEHIDASNNKTKKCTDCNNNTSRTYKYNSPPHFQVIGFTQYSQDIELSKTITLKSEDGPVNLPIREAIYYIGNHFVSRIISPTREVWYQDGIETKCQCLHEYQNSECRSYEVTLKAGYRGCGMSGITGSVGVYYVGTRTWPQLIGCALTQELGVLNFGLRVANNGGR